MNSIIFDYINPNNTVLILQDSICNENGGNSLFLIDL